MIEFLVGAIIGYLICNSGDARSSGGSSGGSYGGSGGSYGGEDEEDEDEYENENDKFKYSDNIIKYDEKTGKVVYFCFNCKGMRVKIDKNNKKTKCPICNGKKVLSCFIDDKNKKIIKKEVGLLITK